MFHRVGLMDIGNIFKVRMKKVLSLLSGTSTYERGAIRFNPKELCDEWSLKLLLDRFPGSSESSYYLYLIYFVEDNSSIHAAARSSFENYRKKNSQNKLSRFNANHPPSRNIYVGTSQDLRSRFRSHLGYGQGKSTWGLYLRHWASRIESEIQIDYFKFKTIPECDIALVESVIWDSLRPMFGKKGGK